MSYLYPLVRGQIAYTVSGALEVGTDVCFPFRPSGNFTILDVYIEVKAVPTGASVIVDINVNGTSIFNVTPANRPEIAISATTATSGAPDTTTLIENDSITVDVDQIGSGDTGEDMTIIIRGTQG
jgi:hypothetical protein